MLRVLHHALESPPPAPVSKPRQQRQIRRLTEIQDEIDSVVRLYGKGKLSEEDFERNYAVLSKEKLALVAKDEEESAPMIRERAITLMTDADDLTETKLRQLMLLVVKRIEAPVIFDGVLVRPDLKTLRRHVRVIMRFADKEGHDRFLAPLRTKKYQGEKVVNVEGLGERERQ